VARIERIEAWAVNVPLEATYLMAPGTFPGVSRTVVRVSTDDGMVGLGECGSAQDAAVVRDGVARQLLGREVGEVLDEFAVSEQRSVQHRSDGRVAFGGARAGIEMALYDAQARAAGVPLHALLGGACRAEVEFSEYFALRQGREQSAEEVGAYCARMVAAHDPRVFEGKVGVRPLEEEVRMVAAVREAIGSQRRLRLDANMGWSLETAVRALDALAEFEIENIEEPVATFEEMAALRRRSTIPFSSHTPDLERATQLGVPDALVLGLGTCGGIGGTCRFIAACERAGVAFWFYSGDLGIATAAYLHVAAAIPYLRWPSQSLLRWMTDDVIVGGPASPEHGVLPVPTGTGLGVELDEDALERCAERHAREGSYDYYSERLPRY
jgi:glucarate dehydratase